MSNASFCVTVKTARSSSDLARFIKDTTDPRGEARVLGHLFDRIKGGLEPANFAVQTSANAPVHATNTLTLTYASISNNDTVVIAGTTLTCVTGTPSGSAQFKKDTDAPTTAANLVTCINANTTLNVLMAATRVSNVVTMTLHVPGVIGNQVPLVGSTGMVVGAAAFASGAGGIETAPVNYSRGL
jgi:hypothetical protein